MSQPSHDRIRSAMAEVMADWQVPGLAVAFARRGQPPTGLVAGADATGRPLAEDSFFPIGSVTKLATTLAVLRLVDAGQLGLDDELGRHLPDAASAAQAGVTIRRLLSHTAGVPVNHRANLAPYAAGLDWPTIARAVLATPPAEPPAQRVLYSNLTFDLLAIVVERLTGQPFPAALTRLVQRPLGLEGYLGVEPPRPPAVVADVRGPHVGTPLESINSPFWRSLGQPSSGLVTTVRGALAIIRAFAGEPAGFLGPDTVAEETRNQVGDLGGGIQGTNLIWPWAPWGLGVMLHGDKSPNAAPPEASHASVGLMGLPGCIVWYDPATGVAWAIGGPRTMLNGWLTGGGPRLGSAILSSA